MKGFFCLITCACSSNAVYVPVDRKEEGKFVKCSLRIKSARIEFLISRHVAQLRQRGARWVFRRCAAIIEKCAWPNPNGHARYPAECQLERDARQRSTVFGEKLSHSDQPAAMHSYLDIGIEH